GPCPRRRPSPPPGLQMNLIITGYHQANQQRAGEHGAIRPAAACDPASAGLSRYHIEQVMRMITILWSTARAMPGGRRTTIVITPAASLWHTRQEHGEALRWHRKDQG